MFTRGRYRVEVRASFSDASAEFSGRTFASWVRSWWGGNRNVSPNCIKTAPSSSANPTVVVQQTRDHGRMNVRSTMVLDVVENLPDGLLSTLITEAFTHGGAQCDPAALRDALRTGRRVSSDEAHAPLTTASMTITRLRAASATPSPRPASGASTAAPAVPSEPAVVPPPAASASEQLAGGTQRQDDGPAQVVTLSPTQAIQAGDGASVAIVAGISIVVILASYFTLKALRR